MLSLVANICVGHFLLAEGKGGGWVQLLIFVVVGAIWLLGNILKSRSDKLDDQKREERKQDGPARSPERETAYRKQLAARLQQQIRQREAAGNSTGRSPKPAYKRPVSGAQSPAAFRVEPVQKPKIPVFPVELPRLEADDLVAEPVQQVRKVRVQKARATVPKEVEEEVEVEFAPIEIFTGGGDWNEFQRAILYLEILGKPVSLREPIA